MNPNMRVEVLETSRLVLRPLREGDEVPLADLLQDPEIHRWTASIPFPYSVEDGREYIALRAKLDPCGESFVWAITDRITDQLMGTIGLHDVVPDRGRAELGYWIGERFQGHGYTTEAARRVVSWSFETAGFERIQATYLPGNSASAAIMQKIGMQPEGLLRGYGFKNDEHHDLYLRAVLKGDSTWMSTADQIGGHR